MSDLHSALKATIEDKATRNGIEFLKVRLQNGKEKFELTLHAKPTTFSTAGVQRTDFLHALGFRRQPCAFHQGDAYCMAVGEGSGAAAFAEAIGAAFSKFDAASRYLESCGLYLAQPVGYGFFHGRPSSSHGRTERVNCHGDGHVAPIVESMKQSEDEYFRYRLTFISGGSDKGWTLHYRPQHMPMSPEFAGALAFIGGFNAFDECPEFDFEPCWWQFVPFRVGQSIMDSNAELVHRHFDTHAVNFSSGVRELLEAHARVQSVGLRLLPHTAPAVPPKARLSTGRGDSSRSPAPRPSTKLSPGGTGESPLFKYDVAFSFAGADRGLVEHIAKRTREEGFQVFYDNFYPEQLWGEDLAATFDRIYRREARFCVMFLSSEYAARMWTSHERRSATARALEERGAAYILPVYVEDVDIDGLPPSLGRLSVAEKTADEIADLLISKLHASKA